MAFTDLSFVQSCSFSCTIKPDAERMSVAKDLARSPSEVSQSMKDMNAALELRGSVTALIRPPDTSDAHFDSSLSYSA